MHLASLPPSRSGSPTPRPAGLQHRWSTCAWAAATLAVAVALDPRAWLATGVAPVLEEIIFRSGLQASLQARAAGRPGLCNLLTAVVFAAAHVVVRPGALAALTVLPALAIGAIYARRRRLGPCIALHAAFNLFWLTLRSA